MADPSPLEPTRTTADDDAQADTAALFDPHDLGIVIVNHMLGLVLASALPVVAIGAAVAQDQIKFELTDGKSQDAAVKAGQAMFTPGGKHLPESVGDKPFEVVLVELKAK